MNKVAIAGIVAGLVMLGAAAYRLAETGRHLGSVSAKLGRTAPGQSATPDPSAAPSATAPSNRGADQDGSGVRSAVGETDGSPPLGAQNAQRFDRQLSALVSQDEDLRKAFEELLTDPDPEIRREASELLETWVED
jgi:hypothetical protein